MKKTEQDPSAKTASRRQFAKSAVAALVVAPAALLGAHAQDRPVQKDLKPLPTPTPTPSPPPSPVADAYMPVARARFGEYISAEELDRVKRDLEGNIRSADRLRASKLKNSDEPDFVFIA